MMSKQHTGNSATSGADDVGFSLILESLCRGEWLDSKTLQRDLESSSNLREFRNRLAAATFSAYYEELQRPSPESTPWDIDEPYREFDAARNHLDKVERDHAGWLGMVERWGSAIDGFSWQISTLRAAQAGSEIIEATRRLARAHRSIRNIAYPIGMTPPQPSATALQLTAAPTAKLIKRKPALPLPAVAENDIRPTNVSTAAAFQNCVIDPLAHLPPQIKEIVLTVGAESKAGKAILAAFPPDRSHRQRTKTQPPSGT